MENLDTILSQAQVPDAWFWYSLSIVLAAALIWIFKRYITRQDSIMDRLTKNLEELKTLTAVHDAEIKNNRKDIDLLKQKVFK